MCGLLPGCRDTYEPKDSSEDTSEHEPSKPAYGDATDAPYKHYEPSYGAGSYEPRRYDAGAPEPRYDAGPYAYGPRYDAGSYAPGYGGGPQEPRYHARNYEPSYDPSAHQQSYNAGGYDGKNQPHQMPAGHMRSRLPSRAATTTSHAASRTALPATGMARPDLLQRKVMKGLRHGG